MAKKTAPDAVNYYDILQVKPGADHEVIKAAADALLKKHHPDHNGGTGNTISSRIIEARSVLLDPDSRSDHDADLRALHENKIGNYKVVRKIAEGGFGRVYEGKHLLLGERVCIKHAINSSDFDTEMFIKEAKVIWDLRHHALPAVRDMVILNDGSCALVMSFIEGPTLFKVVEDYQAKRKTLDPENAAWIMGRVLDALRYLHLHGVIHGDVKPQNIIVQPEKHTAILVDFGLSKARPTSTTKVEGYTPMFAAPETQMEPALPPVPESDLYSLGLTMIFALGGDPLKREVPAKVPAPLREFIESLIRYEVTARPTWEKTNLLEDLRQVRIKAFGREHTNFKKL